MSNQPLLSRLFRGARVDGETVIVTAKGKNEEAQLMCGAIIDAAQQEPEAVEPVGVVPKAGHCILHIPQSTPCALAGYCLNANPQASAPAAHNQDLGVHHAAPDAPADDLNALVAQIVEESRSDWQRARIEIIAQAITDLRAEVERAKAQRDEAWQAFTRLRRAYSMVRYPTLTEELRLLYDAADAVAAGKSEGKA